MYHKIINISILCKFSSNWQIGEKKLMHENEILLFYILTLTFCVLANLDVDVNSLITKLHIWGGQIEPVHDHTTSSKMINGFNITTSVGYTSIIGYFVYNVEFFQIFKMATEDGMHDFTSVDGRLWKEPGVTTKCHSCKGGRCSKCQQMAPPPSTSGSQPQQAPCLQDLQEGWPGGVGVQKVGNRQGEDG